MDRRTVLAIVLSLGIWYGWLALRGKPTPPEGAPGTEAPAADGAVADGANPSTAPAGTAPAPAAPASTLPPVASYEVQSQPITLCDAHGTVSTDGGRLHTVTLGEHSGPYHVTALYSWIVGRVTGKLEGPWSPYGGDPGPAYLLSDHARALATGAGPTDELVRMQVLSTTPTSIELEGTAASGVVIRKSIAERREGDVCRVDVTVGWTNPTSAPIAAEPWLAIADHTPHSGSRYQSQRQPMALVDGSIHYGGALGTGCGGGYVRRNTMLTDTSGPIPFEGPVTWFGLSDRYFGFLALPEHPDQAVLSLVRAGAGDDAIDAGVVSFAGGLEPGATRTESVRVYLGPNDRERLEAVDASLPRAIDLGWFAFFGYPLLWLLREFHALVGNWGLSIILLTFLVKLVFFPMTQRSFKSMQRMQQIQPELTRIKEELKDNPQEMNRRTLELMQKNQVNPLSGCLPTLVQMPVWIALYNVLLTSVELYHTEFLYLKDLSSPDPYCVLPVTITFLMWLQQQLSTPTNLDPVQQQVMRYMPLVFGLMFFAFPSGLGVYVLVNMTLSILQQWVIKRGLGSGPAAAPAAAG
ncbi:MAG: membrane protein insertase YidC [Myxococcota bacterium]